MTKEEKNARQREYRIKNNNAWTKKYEKTKRGFLMRMYRNMQSRVEGIQYKKRHLYEGKSLLSRSEFYEWAINQDAFNTLFTQWEISNYERKIAPSIDRIDSDYGYEINNIRFVTFSENCRNVRRHK